MNNFWLRVQRQVYQEGEELENFALRIGKEVFPDKEEAWFKEHAFTFHSYGLASYVCEKCKGQCPHHGYRYEVRLEKGSDRPKLVAIKDQCEKYKGKKVASK